MCDYREELLQSVKNSLVECGYDHEVISDMERIIVTHLSRYEIAERTTELATVDRSTEQVINLYIGSILTEGKSTKTASLYRRIIERFFDEVRKPVMEVNVFDVRVWLAKVQQQASLRTAENYRSYLSAFYIWLQKEEFIDRNPMAKINPVKYEDKVRQPFTDVEIDALRSGCETPRERAELELMLSSGARVSEVAAMNISDIDLASLTVIIRAGKGNKQRRTFMTEVARKHIMDYIKTRTDDNCALFISKTNERMTTRAISDDIKRIGNRAKVPDVHPHKCRRTFASTLAKKGANIRVIQTLMGHSDINTTMMYITLDSDHVKNEYVRFA